MHSYAREILHVSLTVSSVRSTRPWASSSLYALIPQSFFFSCSLEVSWTHKRLLQVEMVEAASYRYAHREVIQLHIIETNTVSFMSNASLIYVQLALLYLLAISVELETIWCIDCSPLQPKWFMLRQISILPAPGCLPKVKWLFHHWFSYYTRN